MLWILLYSPDQYRFIAKALSDSLVKRQEVFVLVNEPP